MEQVLAVLLNGELKLQYDRRKSLPTHQRLFLDKMDRELQQGVSVGGEEIAKPDLKQRAQFVALNLVRAILTDDEPVAAAMCAYLANYLPDLKQIKGEEKQGALFVDLVFDKAYVPEISVPFTPSRTR